MNCKDVRRYVHAFIDEELAPQKVLELEEHVEACPSCANHVAFEQWFKGEIRDTVGSVSAPVELSGLVRESLAQADRSDRIRSLLPRVGVAAALAAGVLLALFLPGWLTPAETPPVVHRPVIDYVAERHARSLPPEVAGPDERQVSMWFRDKVDFAVTPPRFRDEPVQLVGGRISHVGDQQAAHLFYTHNGHPVTVVVFPGTDMPMAGTQPVQVGPHTVHMGQSRGYNVAVWRRGGVSYAVSSDLDQNDMVRLVASVP